MLPRINLNLMLLLLHLPAYPLLASSLLASSPQDIVRDAVLITYPCRYALSATNPYLDGQRQPSVTRNDMLPGGRLYVAETCHIVLHSSEVVIDNANTLQEIRAHAVDTTYLLLLAI